MKTYNYEEQRRYRKNEIKEENNQGYLKLMRKSNLLKFRIKENKFKNVILL